MHLVKAALLGGAVVATVLGPACSRPKVKELAHRGITLEALLNFYAELLAQKTNTGFEFDPHKHTTADVVTRGQGSKLCNLIGLSLCDSNAKSQNASDLRLYKPSQQKKSGKSKRGLCKWGLKVLVHNCPRLPTIVVILPRKFPLQKATKVHNCTRLCTNCREWP